MDISKEAKIILLKAARQSIGTIFGGDKPEPPDYDKFPELKSKAGAFVTLTIENKLRGCIGYITGIGNLFETVCDAAIQAAENDPRFTPLRQEEFEKIEIEISVLSNFQKLKSYDDIELGKHGLLLEEGGRGLLLPQVATEHKMNREQFLTSLCHKAGLYGDYWRERLLNIKKFTADVFSEKELKEEL
ncbi:MAG: AmmeMemoRadiSam system protein A [Ignavibacterium sp.]|nr:AmmeMemoRadiSam system protein A [Ignavibacterium sp.]MDW8374649.1 AmmeMemoRadiSam system protein A [Ignavibacteriales bacterium]